MPLRSLSGKMVLPYELGWLHYMRGASHEYEDPELGTSVAYGAPYIKGTVYLYQNGNAKRGDLTLEESLEDEFQLAMGDILALNPSAKSLASNVADSSRFASFDIDGRYTALLLSTVNENFLKFRGTIEGSQDRYVFDCLMDSMSCVPGIARALRSI